MTDALHTVWINTPEAINDLAEQCRKAGLFALDTEADSLHSYFHKVCLVQVSVGDTHAVIDPLAVEAEAFSPLWRVCGDPNITLLMHGADYDIRVLDRDYGAEIHGLQDTQIMAMLLGEKKTGLASLLEASFGIELDKRHQRADWGMRPLTGSMVAYAAADTAHLKGLAGILRRRLEDLDRWEWAEEEFLRLECVRHQQAEVNPRAFERVKGVNALRGAARDRAFTLFSWRDGRAQEADMPPFKILGNLPLLHMAETVPEGPRAMGEVPGIGPRFVQRYGQPLSVLLNSPQVAPERVKPERRPPVDPSTKKRMTKLIEIRDEFAARLEVDGSVLCPRATVEAIGELKVGAGIQDFENAGLIGWRLKLLGEAFFEGLK